MTDTITIKEIQEMNCDTFSRKDNSPRGIETICKSDLQIGDEIIIQNHFTRVVK